MALAPPCPSVAPPCPSVALHATCSAPLLGLGTSHQGGFSHEAVVAALRLGCRHIDTAQRYGSEGGVRRAVLEAAVEREELFITDKVWPGNYGAVGGSVKSSLEELGTSYIDLLLLHWPGGGRRAVAAAWRQLELLLEAGTVRSIGVSNFKQRHLDRLLEEAAVVPHLNQVEFHPYQQDLALVEHCRGLGVALGGYSPLAKGLLLQDPLVARVAEQVGATPAQVLIRWSLQMGVITIPKSVRVERVRENWGVWGFELGEEQMAALGGLHRGTRVTWDPDTVP